MHSLATSKELNEESKTLEAKLRPLEISKFSKSTSERQVLLAPLSSFKVDSLPEKVKHDSGFEFYQIKLEYIDTYFPVKE
jgi:hypothetical protein